MNSAQVSRIEPSECTPALETKVESITYRVAKRIADIACGAIGLALLLPLFLAIAICIAFEDGAPVLYYQQRTGFNGKPFRFYKFRTMYRNADSSKLHLSNVNEADGPIFKIKNDPRITGVGKLLRRLSIDETPQLINILRGEMSFVGPRPLPTSEANGCTVEQYRRHSIKPGLLCYREVGGRSQLSFEKWMQLDLDYVDNHNLIIDAGIMLKALPAVIRGDGAY